MAEVNEQNFVYMYLPVNLSRSKFKKLLEVGRYGYEMIFLQTHFEILYYFKAL